MSARLSLRQRLLALAVLALSPALAIVAANEILLRQQREDEVRQYAISIGQSAVAELERALTGVAALMIAMAESPSLDRLDPTDCVDYFSGILREIPQLAAIAAADESTGARCEVGLGGGEAIEDIRRGLAEPLRDQRFALGGYADTLAGPVLPIGLNVTDSSVRLFVGISLELLGEVLFSEGFGSAGSIMVTDRAGTVLAQHPVADSVIGAPLPDSLVGLASAASPGALWLDGAAGSQRVIGYVPATDRLPFAAVVSIPADGVMAPINRATARSVAIAATGALLALLLAWVFGEAHIRLPVRQLLQTIAARRAGQREARTGATDTTTELGAVAQAMDALFDELDRTADAQARAEAQRDMLARELQHRIKNMLAVTQAIASQTLAKQRDVPEVRAFEGRLRALIRAHSTLGAEATDAVGIRSVVEETQDVLTGSDSERIGISGPDVTLRPKVAAALSMTLHELGTNAIKYGALSGESGSVCLRWSVKDSMFGLTWEERGGPPVTPPERRGFGTTLISSMLRSETGGDAEIRYLPEGVTFRFSCPLEALGAAAPDHADTAAQ